MIVSAFKQVCDRKHRSLLAPRKSFDILALYKSDYYYYYYNTVKYFSRASRKLVHSTNICFTVSGIPQD